jgi:predicted small integral membrane protein
VFVLLLLSVLRISFSASRGISVNLGHTHGTVALSDELEKLFVMLLVAKAAVIVLAATSLHGEGAWLAFTASVGMSFLFSYDSIQIFGVCDRDV